MKRLPQVFIIFLSVDWNLFNRREMVRALAEAVKKHGSTIIAVNRPLCPFTTFLKKRNRIKELFVPAGVERLSDNLILYSPKYFVHDHIAAKAGFLERLNIFALQKSFGALFRQLGIKDDRPVVWYYYPEQGYVSQIFKERFLIYELYDELADVLGNEITSMVIREKKLKVNVDLFLSVVSFLFDKYSPGYKHSYLFGNGLSRETFESLKGMSVNSQGQGGHPRIGYAGMVSDRIDWDLIREMALGKTGWDFDFHGIILDENIPRKFENVGNVSFHGSYAQEELPGILAGYDVAILPYLSSDFLNHLHPLKFFEYAAAALPVVSSLNYEFEDFPESLVCMPEHNAQSWIEAINRRLSADRAKLKEVGLEIAEQYVWDNMCEKLVEKISELYS